MAAVRRSELHRGSTTESQEQHIVRPIWVLFPRGELTQTYLTRHPASVARDVDGEVGLEPIQRPPSHADEELLPS